MAHLEREPEKMSVNYAPSYIDEVFERRDDYALDTIITVRAKSAPLPDECALFTRMNAFSWKPSQPIPPRRDR
jgi:hypothetical protein